MDGDAAHAAGVAAQLTRARLTVTHLEDGRLGLAEALQGRHDVVVIDLLLRGLTGLEVCRALRARSLVPVLVLSSLDSELDRVRALEDGADDFMARPAPPLELLARLRALVRRARGAGGPQLTTLRIGPLELSPASRSARLEGRSLPLTTTEFRILKALADRSGRILTRQELVTLVGAGDGRAVARSVDAHICRLRQKLGDDPQSPRLLRTVRGAGYSLAAEDGFAP